MKKVTQLLSLNGQLLALCEDGTVWFRYFKGINEKSEIHTETERKFVPQGYKAFWKRMKIPRTKTRHEILFGDKKLLDDGVTGKIHAMKTIREECGCGLKEVKDAVDFCWNNGKRTYGDVRKYLNDVFGYFR